MNLFLALLVRDTIAYWVANRRHAPRNPGLAEDLEVPEHVPEDYEHQDGREASTAQLLRTPTCRHTAQKLAHMQQREAGRVPTPWFQQSRNFCVRARVIGRAECHAETRRYEPGRDSAAKSASTVLTTPCLVRKYSAFRS